MAFVKSYDLGSTSGFRKLAATTPRGDAGSDVVACGTAGERGSAARVAPDGGLVWSRTYSLEGARLAFTDVVAADDGDFILMSTPALGALFPECVLVRIDGAGHVRWARRLKTLWNGALRVLRSHGRREEFLVVAWGPRTLKPLDRRKTGIGTLALVNRDGELSDCVELTFARGSRGAGRLLDAIAIPNGYVLVGDAADPRKPEAWRRMESELDVSGTAGLCIEVDLGLKPRAACLMEASAPRRPGVHVSPRTLIASTASSVVVAGRITSGSRQSTFAATIGLGTQRPPPTVASVYDVVEGAEHPVRIDRIDEDMAVLVVGDSSARSASVLRIDTALQPRTLHRLDIGGSALFDLRTTGPRSVALAGATSAPPAPDRSVLATLDERLECCKTTALPPPERRPLEIPLRSVDIRIERPDATIRPAAVVGAEARPAVASLCGVALPVRGERLVQSPHLNLQAAGSDGTDASRGVLLRWFLDGALNEHLPKGDMAQNTQRFNKPDDFVRIYRAAWPAAGVPVRRLSFLTDKPTHVDDGQRALYFSTGAGTPPDLFVVTFSHKAAYAAARQAVDPLVDPAGFVATYGAHPFEVELRGPVSVACDLELQAGGSGSVEVETRSVADSRPLAARTVTSRRILSSSDGPVARLLAENMRSVRVRCSGTQIRSVAFTSYDDVLSHVDERRGWTKVGEFSLTTDETTAFRRLEDPARFQVHALWRKFNDGACVNVSNYRARWSAPDGLAAAVQTYRQLSQTDPRAVKAVPGAVPAEDGEISLSYLEMLELASFDYHVARMMGGGHVDFEVAGSTSYVHVAEYVTLGDLGDGGGARGVQHLYMSLPTSLDDARLPLVPDLDGVEYGVSVPTGSGAPYSLTDPQGYTPDGLARYVRLYPGCGPLYDPEQGFFDPPHLFDLSESSLPVLYGVEYRLAGETDWRKPEIAHDPDFLDTRSTPQPETLVTPFPDTRHDSAFIHRETEPGVHEYAVFGVNLFSRASAVSAPRATDVTTFRRRNTLLPPSDVQAQYIQKESPLVLTTASEQSMLASLVQAGVDPVLVRVCFNYDFAQEANYDFADTIQVLHRREVPGNVVGGVKAIGPGSDPRTLRVELEPYTYASGHVASPALPPAKKTSFVGGVLIGGNQRLVIKDVEWPPSSVAGADPIFVVSRPTTTGVRHNEGQNTLVIEDVPVDLHPGDLVMAIENMAAAATWGVVTPAPPGADNPLATTISLGDPSWVPQVRTESFARPDGKLVTRRLRGVWTDATITQVSAAGEAPPRYEVVFGSFVLGQHPQSNAPDPVSWWKGRVRVPVTGRSPEDRRTLTVTQVFTTQPGGKFALEAVDDAGEQGSVAAGPALVNYYPGYKVYLHADGAHGFDQAALEPSAGEGSRTSIIGLRSVDSSTTDVAGSPYASAVGTPQLVTAVEIVSPMAPQKPRGPAYATPSDGYGKSTYTLAIDFDHPPFAVVVYRADALSILEALYDVGTTLPAVLDVMFPPGEDAFFAERLDDLFAFTTDARASMDEIPASGGFVLPNPDAPPRGVPGPPLSATDKKRVRDALLKAFVPLTEQPLIYDLIRTDLSYVPTNRKQSFRDADGNVLSPGDPGFDLAPMAKRPGAANRVQFTDFTLDGTMNPNTVYYYFAREIGNRMDMSDPSPIFGPVALVNLTPPAPPTLRNIRTVTHDPETGSETKVRFEVIAPSSSDPMARLCIYRTSVAALALSVRTMQLVKEVDLALVPISTDRTIVVADDFASDPFLPYGEPLFYRLAWVRKVPYEDAGHVAQVASVPSAPTQPFLTSIVDVTNPLPPLPTLKVVSVAPNGDKMLRVVWDKTVHNGTYYVSKLDPAGNWTRLGEVATNDPVTSFDLQDALPVNDEDGDPIHYRFKVDVQGASGLLNNVEKPVIVRLDQVSLA